MTVFEALVLGLVQGLTEFIPISSSGHLVIVPALLGWQQPPVAFDVYLHGATLVAVLLYFRRELIQLSGGLRRPGPERRVVALLVLATIPAAVVGVVFESRVERVFDEPVAVSLLLVGTGAILVLSELVSRRRQSKPDLSESSTVESLAGSLTSPGAFSIGAGQAVAILPGFSRSGWTIAAGLMNGLDRVESARFSFLLSIPILAGAAIVQIPDLYASDIGVTAIAVGGLASLVSSYLAVSAMIGFLQRRSLYPFAVYCFIAGPFYALLLR